MTGVPRSWMVVVCLAAASLASNAATAGEDGPPTAIERVLTPQVREAFAKAALEPGLWEEATRDSRKYLAGLGIEIPPDAGVSFLDYDRRGDWVLFRGAGFNPLLEAYCPPARVWWNECRKIIRACDQKTVAIKDRRGQVVSLVTVDTNCHFVCEQSIWEESFELPTRPPFPPLP